MCIIISHVFVGLARRGLEGLHATPRCLAAGKRRIERKHYNGLEASNAWNQLLIICQRSSLHKYLPSDAKRMNTHCVFQILRSQHSSILLTAIFVWFFSGLYIFCMAMAIAQSAVGVHAMNARIMYHVAPLVKAPLMDSFTIHPNSPSRKLSNSFSSRRIGSTIVKRTPFKARAEVQASGDGTAAAYLTQFKHVLLPIIDSNPYLTEGTRQAVATTTALAKKYGADITVVVIDENSRDAIADHDARLSSIHWHLAQGGFEEFSLMERLGEGKKPTAVIGEVADDLNLDLVVISMESIHSKYVDGNLLAEFIPCPVLLLPL